MSLFQLHDEDLAQILADAGNSFVHNGNTYPCILGDLVTRKPNEDGGFIAEYDLTITTRKSLIQGTIAAGHRVATEAGEYRVESVRENQSGAIIVLNLISVNKL